MLGCEQLEAWAGPPGSPARTLLEWGLLALTRQPESLQSLPEALICI